MENEMIQLDNDGLNQLYATRKWSMFLSILGFVFLGLVLVISVIMIITGGINSRIGYSAAAMIPLILISATYFFPIYYLFKFSYFSKLALNNKDMGLLSTSLRYLKMHYRFMGILVIIILSLYFVFIIIVLISGSLMNVLQH